MENKRSDTEIKLLKAFGWDFVQVSHEAWEWIKFDEGGQPLARQGSMTWKLDQVMIELASTVVEESASENTRLRAALAQSDQPCPYCTLSKEDWAKCKLGFPGCSRADDAMGCPELGAALELVQVEARETILRVALEKISQISQAKTNATHNVKTLWAVRECAYAAIDECTKVLETPQTKEPKP